MHGYSTAVLNFVESKSFFKCVCKVVTASLINCLSVCMYQSHTMYLGFLLKSADT